tara:strand:+ start:13603 stop:13827 length:225 start_codon:yes stop_codon:yes gene_type:complete
MRIVQIVLMQLGIDKLIQEENLQRLVNSKDDTNPTTLKIKECLKELVMIDSMIKKWNDYTGGVTNASVDNNSEN